MSFTQQQKDTIKSAVKKVFGEDNVKLSSQSGNSLILYELGKRKKSTILYTIDEQDVIIVEFSLRLPNCPIDPYIDYLTMYDYDKDIAVSRYPMTVSVQADVIRSLIGACI